MTNNYTEQCNEGLLAALGHSLIDLSAANTHQILSVASQLSLDRQTEATAILARLRQLNPDVAKQFQLKQDTLSRLDLRMITTQPPTGRSITSFIIVSYCWHYPEWPLARAAQPVTPGWKISKAMADAVLSFRENDSEGVWLDQLCINQASDPDKQNHVGSMDVIYRSARRLIILLEDVQLEEDEQDAGLAYKQFYQDMGDELKENGLEREAKLDFMDNYFPRHEKEHHPSLRADVKKFASKVLKARWFSRAWCAHESRVTTHGKINNPLFLCFGNDGHVLSFEFRFVYYLGLYLTRFEPEHSPVNSNHFNDPNPQSMHQLWWRISRLLSETHPSCSAMQHLVNVLSFGCRFVGDLMSIALNTSGIPLSHDGTVLGLQDVVWMFSLLVIASGDAIPLVADGGKLRMADGSISWTTSPTQGVLNDSILMTNPALVTKATADYIELDLLLLTTLPAAPSTASLEKAIQLIEEYSLEDLTQEYTAAADPGVQKNVRLMGEVMHNIKKGQPGPLHVFVRTWLAHGIDCGLDWLVRFPDNMTIGTGETWMHGTLGQATDERLRTAASKVLDLFPGAHGEVAIRNVMRFLRTILDPRLKLLTANPRRIPVSTTDFAYTASSSNRSYIAIPSAIAHLPAWYKRAWQVEPFDPAGPREKPEDHLPDLTRTSIPPDEKAEDVYPVLSSDYADKRAQWVGESTAWRLRRREEVFGSGSFVADGVHTVLLKKRRVYGAEDYDWMSITAAARKLEGT